jgi:PTS system mannitol-specific IIC component
VERWVTPLRSHNIRLRVQQLGAFLSGMIVPNIAAFLAWGTALFAPGGWD